MSASYSEMYNNSENSEPKRKIEANLAEKKTVSVPLK